MQAAIDAGLNIDEGGPPAPLLLQRAPDNVFQEVAKFRAVRKMWAESRDRFGATNPRAQMVRFHTQDRQLDSWHPQQPGNNIVRVALQGFHAVCGGTQSLHADDFFEALGLPGGAPAKIPRAPSRCLLTSQGCRPTPSPRFFCYYVERLTAEMESRARA